MLVVFINLKPNIESNHPRHVLPPLDIGYCASLLEKNGNKANLIDLNINNINGRPLSSGMVFVRVKTANQQVVKKCIILKN